MRTLKAVLALTILVPAVYAAALSGRVVGVTDGDTITATRTAHQSEGALWPFCSFCSSRV